MFEGEVEQCVTAMQFQLLTDIRPMLFDCAGANAQAISDLFAGFVRRDQSQHLSFGWGEVIKAGLLFF